MILIGSHHTFAYIGRFPAARTALVMWQAVCRKASWRSPADVLAHFPATKFPTPRLASFSLVAAECSVTAQIAFNTGVLIVLDVGTLDSLPVGSS
ncbi:MAG: type II toxin-antitoxin system HigB family toxin [Alicycliphilus denitrificans]|nr:type II toxin-antitoxin system HigB family toxin [Acidovorax sp. GBBC 3333]MBN9575417.1 type II toxin-antitoxin system HigB family toxin [Alicycliphilus denitrificans]MDA8458631.1 type II toxin-antitoxin system HigB family toxin [Acidovorax sp. GBBC 3333]